MYVFIYAYIYNHVFLYFNFKFISWVSFISCDVTGNTGCVSICAPEYLKPNNIFWLTLEQRIMSSASSGIKLEAGVMRITKRHIFCSSQIITEIKKWTDQLDGRNMLGVYER